MNHVELTVQRRLTREFIAADSNSIALQRSTSVSTGAGGVKPGPTTTLGDQVLRLVPVNSTSFAALLERIEGNVQHETHLLVGVWNADIESKDKFELDGNNYEVTFIDSDSTYRKVAGVINRGSGA